MDASTPQPVKTTASSSGRFVSLVAVLMLGVGSCCCQAALVRGLVPAEQSCCGQPANSALPQEDCGCATQVMTEGKAERLCGLSGQAGSVTKWLDVSAIVLVLRAPVPLHPVTPLAHAPPPRAPRSILQVWLI